MSYMYTANLILTYVVWYIDTYAYNIKAYQNNIYIFIYIDMPKLLYVCL